MVIDADGLYIVNQNIDIIKGYKVTPPGPPPPKPPAPSHLPAPPNTTKIRPMTGIGRQTVSVDEPHAIYAHQSPAPALTPPIVSTEPPRDQGWRLQTRAEPSGDRRPIVLDDSAARAAGVPLGDRRSIPPG